MIISKRSSSKCLILVLCLLSWSGCTRTIPTTPHGVLSTIHQKTLALASERALEQAGVTTEQYGKHTLRLRLADIAETDLGKQHSGRVIKDHFRKVAAGLVDRATESATNADKDVEVQILLAGVDVKNGAFFGFSWLETTAEVSVRLTDTVPGQPPIEREGTGNSIFQQVWWLGIGPSEKLK